MLRITKRRWRMEDGGWRKTTLSILHLLSSILVLGICCAPAGAGPATTRSAKIRIVLAGDSTVTDKAGWGPGFARLLTADVECINLSRGGRSSKSFIDEGAWKQCLAAFVARHLSGSVKASANGAILKEIVGDPGTWGKRRESVAAGTRT